MDGEKDWVKGKELAKLKSTVTWMRIKNPHSSVGKESACSTGDLGSIPGLGRSPGEGDGNPLQYSCLGHPMDRGAWQATVHRVTRVGHILVTKPPPPPRRWTQEDSLRVPEKLQGFWLTYQDELRKELKEIKPVMHSAQCLALSKSWLRTSRPDLDRSPSLQSLQVHWPLLAVPRKAVSGSNLVWLVNGWEWTVLWQPTRPSRTNTPKRCHFQYRGLEHESRKSRDTWSNRQIWPREYKTKQVKG